MSTITIGVDLAKSTFSTCTLDANGRVVSRQDFKRHAFGLWLAGLATGTVVAMEACSGAHYWVRRCGIVVAKGDKALRRELADLDVHAGLPGECRELLCSVAAHWAALRMAFDACSARIETHARQDARCERVRGPAGIGPMTADAVVATVGSAREFRNGRQMAAWLGLVPSQHSSWIRELERRMPFDKVLVAIANKHARQIWAMLAHDADYDPCASVQHPMQQRTHAAA